jgi:hypothetical protein
VHNHLSVLIGGDYEKQQKIKHWQGIFEQQKSSALTIIQFCRDNNVNASTFYAWRKRLYAESTDCWINHYMI